MRSAVCERWGRVENALIIQAAEKRENGANSEKEPEVSYAIDQERFHVGPNRAFSLVPEPDQQIRNQPDRFPAEKQLEKVVRHHQHQHCKSEECDVAEKPRISRILRHVADGVDMDHERDESDNHHHHR